MDKYTYEPCIVNVKGNEKVIDVAYHWVKRGKIKSYEPVPACSFILNQLTGWIMLKK